MTTICAVSIGDQKVMACDNRVVLGDQVFSDSTDSQKILRLKDSLIGFSGNPNIKSIFQFDDDIQALNFSNKSSIFLSLKAIHEILKEKYYLKDDNEDLGPFEGSGFNALILNNDGIFSVHTEREIVKHKKFWAIGSGFEFCLGALSVQIENQNSIKNTADICRMAIESSAKFDTSTGNGCMYENLL